MIKLLGNIPNRVAVAVSGGPDSMAALNFYQNNGRREVLALYFNHGTEHAAEDGAFTRTLPLRGQHRPLSIHRRISVRCVYTGGAWCAVYIPVEHRPLSNYRRSIVRCLHAGGASYGIYCRVVTQSVD